MYMYMGVLISCGGTYTLQGFIQNFSSEGGNHSVQQYTQTRGSGGMLPQEDFEIYDL